MQARQWIVRFFVIVMLILGSVQLWLLYKGIPPRFSNSISYDAKIAFLGRTGLLDKADTLVVGSSMALNNVNGVVLEENSSQINRVANISSWGLEPIHIYQLLQVIDLKNIKTVIYSLQYGDFTVGDSDRVYSMYDVKRFLKHKIVFRPYFKRFTTAREDFDIYDNFDEYYHDPQDYRYLVFDRTGGVSLNIKKENISHRRWIAKKYLIKRLDPKAFIDFQRLIDFIKEHNIRLIVVRSPIRKAVLDSRPKAAKRVEEFSNKIAKITKKSGVSYLDLGKRLNLDDSCFVDFEHLSHKGTKIYTQAIIKYGSLK